MNASRTRPAPGQFSPARKPQGGYKKKIARLQARIAALEQELAEAETERDRLHAEKEKACSR